MKKISYLIIIIFLLMNINISSQWEDEVLINFTIQSNTDVTSYVDANGVHIVYSRNGGIRYALVNSNGDIIKYDKVIESEGSGTDFANVVADGNNVYAVYYKNNDIKIAKSTNLGDSWNTTFSYYDCKNTGCNKILAYRKDNIIHITWSEVRIGQSAYDVHYVRFITSSSSWSAYQRVTDQDANSGYNPDLTLSSQKIHVNYTGDQTLRNRDRLITWNNPESVPFYQHPLTTSIEKVKPLIVGSRLNTIYQAQWHSFNSDGYYIGHSYRDVNGSMWYQNETTLETDLYDLYNTYSHVASNTADEKIHIIYWDKNEEYWVHRSITGTTVSSVIEEVPISERETNSLVSNSNDLYIINTTNISTPGKISFRHYDAAPLAPQNLSVEKSENNHPYLSWTANTDADRYYYKVYRIDSYGGGPVTFQTTFNYYEDESLDYCTAVPPATCPNERNFSYYVTAIDKGINESEQSNTVVTTLVGSAADKISINNPNNSIVSEYALGQNYPNPFNPVTSINYQIKEKGFVTLKIYDMLGREVADLVSEDHEPGQYSVMFNASNLPSGVYVYSLRVNDFFQNNKMTLLK